MINIEIIDYQYGYAEIPINGTRVIVDDVEIFDIQDIEEIDKRAKILEAVLKHLKIEFNVSVTMDFD